MSKLHPDALPATGLHGAGGSRGYPSAVSVEDFRHNLATVHMNIATAARRVGRNPADIRLLPVSKTVPAERIRLALAAGCRVLGENKVQEGKGKSDELAAADVSWSLIGHLQTNKVNSALSYISEFQALDSLRLAETLDKRLQAAGRGLDVYLQVNTSAEDQKFGIQPNEVNDFLHRLRPYTSLRVRGLMTLAIFTEDTSRVRECFTLLRNVRDRARETHPDVLQDGGLSMGMSGDYKVAIEEGATCIRVGQAIFGPRATPNEHYWPGAAS